MIRSAGGDAVVVACGGGGAERTAVLRFRFRFDVGSSIPGEKCFSGLGRHRLA